MGRGLIEIEAESDDVNGQIWAAQGAAGSNFDVIEAADCLC